MADVQGRVADSQAALVQKLIAQRKGLGAQAAAGASSLGAQAGDLAPEHQPGGAGTLGQVVGDMTAWDSLTQGMTPEDKEAFRQFLSGLPTGA